ncbi:hypothetical protein [Chitinophaga niabensis]|uniref:Uncharacterized protein n=1 Tax=Chitinophaga niabensis TaxID=536979 RepID=A0A1N6DRU5_9BACT|nr:hypothetical protein [Chitinophaga niabensis]SIN73509.1 hypothetical protein SAMN04488055_1029 [Chitinophaga niabensis]
MAKQTGPMQLEGTVGNFTFYKTKDGFIVRLKSQSKAITNDRTKENMSEFGRAASGARLVRKTFASIISDIRDFYFTRRLNSQMARVVKADPVSPRGFRNIADGDIELLQGLDVNTDMPLTTAFKASFVPSIDRASGLMRVDFPALITSSLLAKPQGASHFRLTIAGASIDFTTGYHLVAQHAGQYLIMSNEGVVTTPLEVQLPAASTAPLILALGISFYQEVNGQFYLIGNGSYNAVAFVAVSGS